MRILLSGASSFTGYWLGKALADAGHHVTGLYRRGAAPLYDGVRLERVNRFAQFSEQQFGCVFGEDRFLEIVRSGSWDIYCHHASDVANYRSPEFDPLKATHSNTHNLPLVLEALKASGCETVVFTGTVFERGEGHGSENLPHISRYGLSKALSWEVFQYHCTEQEVRLKKFIIPNPFGPLEEPRFTNYLVKCWRLGETPNVLTPDYVRDNIHVDLLALEYARFVTNDAPAAHPSGYVESQGRFAQRFAQEFRKRSGWKCPVVLDHQTDFSEPRIRINHDSAVAHQPTWNESLAWDRTVQYYLTTAKTL